MTRAHETKWEKGKRGRQGGQVSEKRGRLGAAGRGRGSSSCFSIDWMR